MDSTQSFSLYIERSLKNVSPSSFQLVVESNGYTYLRPTDPAVSEALNELVRNFALLIEQTTSTQLITFLDDQNPYLQRCADSLPGFKDLACGFVNNSSSIGYHVALMPLSSLHNGLYYNVEFTKLLAYPMATPVTAAKIVRSSNDPSRDIIAYVWIVLEVRYFKLRAQDPDLSPADEMCFNVAVGHIGVPSVSGNGNGNDESLMLGGLSSFGMSLGGGGLLDGLGGLGFSLGMSIDPSLPAAASSPNLQSSTTETAATAVAATSPSLISDRRYVSSSTTSDEQHRENQERMDKPANFKPGDWMCECGDHVFAKKSACFKCGTPKPAWVLPPPIPISHHSNSTSSSSHSAVISNSVSVSNNGSTNVFSNGNTTSATVKDLTVKERNKQRTDVCYAFQRGECVRGNGCRFVHILEKRNRDKKDRANEICYQFQRGECSRGAACRFLHVKESGNERENLVNVTSSSNRPSGAPSISKGVKK